MKIDIVVFDGFDEMDAVGPYEVFRTAAELGSAPIEAELVGAHGAATITASHGMRLVVDRGPADDADMVLVPGGGWFTGAGIRDEIERGVLAGVLTAARERGAIVGSVCTGAMMLAAAGLVDGRRATTHHSAIEDLREAGAQIVDGARYVDDGDLVTAGGVTSGLDLALHIVETVAGASVAAAVAREIEYEPRVVAAP